MNVIAIDDELFLELLPIVLSKARVKNIAVGASVADALEKRKITEPPFDCLFIDTRMPEMDGNELFKAFCF